MGRDLNFRWTKIEQPNEIQPIHLIANGSIKPSLSRVCFKCFCQRSQISYPLPASDYLFLQPD